MSWRRQVGFAGVWMALIMLLMACGSSTGTSSTLGSAASATMPASGNVAPEWLVVKRQYSDQPFIDMIVPPHMMAGQMGSLVLPERQHPGLKQLATSIH